MVKTVSPIDGKIFVERKLATSEDLNKALAASVKAQKNWRSLPLDKRQEYVSKMVDAFIKKKQKIAEELTWQMGRPLRYTPFEVDRFEERARMMIRLAPEGLADVQVEPRDGFTRFIRRVPLGVALVLAPWNYPYLTAVNAVVPALLAGNSVVLKHSAQTPLCSERIVQAAEEASLPEGVIQFLHMSHGLVAEAIKDDRVNHVAFTGSVEGGRDVQHSMADRFITMGLELGGKDPAYVRKDADLTFAIDNVVDGAYFNSGQSCCGIERVYVDEAVYDAFVEGAVELVKKYVLGNPLEKDVTLGPVVSISSARDIQAQIDQAVTAGAKALIDPKHFPAASPGTTYLAPQLLVNVDHKMDVMYEETFGPVVGIMKVKNDEEAIELMNDSPYGLTASIWTSDEEAALRIGGRIETGTVFMNRCDYLDPELAWVGVKNSGRGCTLSRVGYEYLTRPKSFHYRTKIPK
ncbi:MAG TPA: aldehyde dehydrogenase family protein [Spirochaetota bacterium]|nr:aldehyde dehydrogenase family protein [Spirochaetota bacterium]